MLRLRSFTSLLCLTTSRGAFRADSVRLPLSKIVAVRARCISAHALHSGEDEDPLTAADEPMAVITASGSSSPDSGDATLMSGASTGSSCQDGLILVDGHALAYRMHFALLSTGMTTKTGEPTHALHGFCTKLIDLHQRWPAHRMIVCFDLPGPTFRTAELPGYKANRPPMPLPLQPQVNAMFEASELMGSPAMALPGYEADDLIAACVSAARARGVPDVIIVSSDKDLLQLLSDGEAPTRVAMWNDRAKEMMDAEAVVAKHGVRPHQMGDLLALMGDQSDAVPGVPGVGAKVAAQLLGAHGSLEKVLESAAGQARPSKREAALVQHAETARLARRLVALAADAPVDADSLILGSPPDGFGEPSLHAFLRRWELFKVSHAAQRLAKRRPTTLGWTPPQLAGLTPGATEAGAMAAAGRVETVSAPPPLEVPADDKGGEVALPRSSDGPPPPMAGQAEVASVSAAQVAATEAAAAAEQAWRAVEEAEAMAEATTREAEAAKEAAKAAAKALRAARTQAARADKAAIKAAAKAAAKPSTKTSGKRTQSR